MRCARARAGRRERGLEAARKRVQRSTDVRAPAPDKIGPDSDNFGEIDRRWPELGQLWFDFDRLQPDRVRPIWGDLLRIWSDIEQFCLVPAKSMTSSAAFADESSGVGESETSVFGPQARRIMRLAGGRAGRAISRRSMFWHIRDLRIFVDFPELVRSS